jgi:hypothetical protein
MNNDWSEAPRPTWNVLGRNKNSHLLIGVSDNELLASEDGD